MSTEVCGKPMHLVFKGLSTFNTLALLSNYNNLVVTDMLDAFDFIFLTTGVDSDLSCL